MIDSEMFCMNGKNIVQAFQISEYRARLDKVRGLMSDAGMVALVVTSEANQCYLLGYESFSGAEPQAVLVTLDDDPYFILRKMDADFAADAGCWLPHDRVVGYSESFVGGSGGDSAWELIGQFVNDKVGASARIGVERSALRGTDYHKLVGALGVPELLDGSGLVSALRAGQIRTRAFVHERGSRDSGPGDACWHRQDRRRHTSLRCGGSDRVGALHRDREHSRRAAAVATTHPWWPARQRATPAVDGRCICSRAAVFSGVFRWPTPTFGSDYAGRSYRPGHAKPEDFT